MRVVVAALSVVLLATCVTSLTPAAREVMVTNDPAEVKSCEFLGELKAADHLHGGDEKLIAWWNCTRKLRNAAAARRANVVLITESHSDISTRMTGKACRCPDTRTAPR